MNFELQTVPAPGSGPVQVSNHQSQQGYWSYPVSRLEYTLSEAESYSISVTAGDADVRLDANG